jgi:hypothetical protein
MFQLFLKPEVSEETKVVFHASKKKACH